MPKPSIWRPWCFECQRHVAEAEWTRLQCLLRWSKKCDACGRKCHAASVLLRNILLVPIALLVGSLLSAVLQRWFTEPGVRPVFQALAPLLAGAICVFYLLPSWLGWNRFYRQAQQGDSPT